MRFYSALFAYLLMGAVLAWGIVLTFKGNYWVLGVGFVAYLITLIKVGCLPSSDQDH